MAALSDFIEAQLINHIFRGSTYPKPNMLAIALCGSPALDSDSGNFGGTVGQLTGHTGRELFKTGDYRRYEVGPPADIHFTAPGADGITDNASGFTWPQATSNWGWISGIAIVDSTLYGSGSVLMHGALTTAKQIASGDTFRVQTGDCDITFQ